MSYHPHAIDAAAITRFMRELIGVHMSACEDRDLCDIIDVEVAANGYIQDIEGIDPTTLRLSIKDGAVFTLRVTRD